MTMVGFSLMSLLVIPTCLFAQYGWQQIATVPEQPWSMCFVSSQVGFYGGDINNSAGTFRKTTDGGQTWVSMPWPYAIINTIHFLNADTGFAACRNGELRKTTDGGNTWAVKFADPGHGELRGLCFYNAQYGWVTLSTKVARTTDGGETWTAYDVPMVGLLLDVSFGTPQTGIVVGLGNIRDAFRSTDGGITWTQIFLTSNLTYEAVHFLSQTTVVAAGYDGIILSTNSGGTWSVRSTGSPVANRLTFPDPRNGWASGGNRIRRTTDGGVTWVDQQWSRVTDLLGITSMDSLNAWTFGNGRVFQTTTGGNLPSPPPPPILRSPQNGASGLRLPVQLTWDSLTTADGYRIQLADDSLFTSLAVDDSSLVSARYVASSLSYGATYFWRVAGRNINGYGSWSEVSRFQMRDFVPILLSPANGATGLSLPLWLKWDTLFTALSYKVQVSTDSQFTTLVVNESLLTSPNYNAYTLSYGTAYFWRACARNLAGNGAWSSVSRFQTRSSMLAPVLTVPANGSDVSPIGVFFSWNSDSAVSYRLQVSTDSVFSNVVFDDSAITTQSRTISSLSDSTTYFWHVRARTTDGRTFWSGIWSFRSRSLFPFATGNTWWYRSGSMRTPAVAGTIKEIVTALPSGFRRINARTVFRYNRPDSSWTEYWLERSGRLYRSADTNNLGIQVYDAAILRDTTFGGAPYWITYDHFTLSVFDTSFAAQRIGEHATSHAGGWVRVTESAPSLGFYYTQYSGGGIFADNDTSILVGMLKDGVVYGDTTVEIPTPVLQSPPNGGQNQPRIVIFTWLPFSSAISYRLQISTDSLFGFTVVDDSSLATTSRSVGPLLDTTHYYWRVQAITPGGLTYWSSVWSFTTVNSAARAPQLVLPSNGAIDQPLRIALEWSPIAGAISYRAQLATDSLFGTPLIDDSALTTTSRFVGPLSDTTRYHWRIASNWSDGQTYWSSVWSFTTVNSAARTPQLVSPPDGVTDQPLNLALEWSAVPGAISYRAQLSTDSLFATPLVDDSTITATLRSIEALSDTTQYFWRVGSKWSDGQAYWSQVWRFTTMKSEMLPTEFVLSQNYPNPFNPQTTIRFALPTRIRVVLSVFDVLGREVRRLVSGDLPTGIHERVFDASELASGVYVYRLQAGHFVETKKLVLLR